MTAATPQSAEPGVDPRAMLDGWLKEVFAFAVRGAIASMVRVPAEVTMIATCKAVGAVMGSLSRGDELAVARFRKACRDAFKEGIRDEPVAGAPDKPAS